MKRPVMFHAARLIDGISPNPIENAALLVDEGGVIATGHPDGIGKPEGALIVDLGDVTLLPGLIDAHVHLMFDASADPLAAVKRDSDGMMLYRMAKNGRLALASGVTTVRDCGCRKGLLFTFKQAVAEGLLPGPDVVACDRVITTPGGHLAFAGVEAQGLDQLRATVARQVEAGVDFIKVMGSGGRIEHGRGSLRRAPQFSLEELSVIVDEAHHSGLRVAVHVHPTRAIEWATEAGVDSIEHCLWLGAEGAVAYSEDAVEKMVEQGTFVVPTMARFFPPSDSGAPPDSLLPDLDVLLPLYARMRDAGVRFVAGGDTGASHTPFGSFVRNLELMEKFGMSTRELLVSATSLAAECVGRHDIGALTPGRRADFIAVSGSPLENIKALWNVEAVYRAGRRVWRRNPSGDLAAVLDWEATEHEGDVSE